MIHDRETRTEKNKLKHVRQKSKTRAFVPHTPRVSAIQTLVGSLLKNTASCHRLEHSAVNVAIELTTRQTVSHVSCRAGENLPDKTRHANKVPNTPAQPVLSIRTKNHVRGSPALHCNGSSSRLISDKYEGTTMLTGKRIQKMPAYSMTCGNLS
eukprot:gnl/MRDRNA2_/MRDRNA2_373435_c0_seq1.p2 gnl/MRDRNA2_/MRDRNA2_373435_c0~~gnl/MRDRNA2_/MRDRNA2_373435_c0_seq1.p2  ORF type:complete len:154 (+),score=7.43 gnl/MRDRNA2_/MRDRNA2_373435_c0_seq1:51-512(+)